VELFHVAHAVVLGMWPGVVFTEELFEFIASDADSLRAPARCLYNVGKFGGLPIAATGGDRNELLLVDLIGDRRPRVSRQSGI
jgi:hypothetical protein